jgi:hypothetical protein
VTTGAVLALERLARRDGIPQRAMLERLILAADAAVLASLTPDTPEWGAYFGHCGWPQRYRVMHSRHLTESRLCGVTPFSNCGHFVKAL